ncbi:glutathione S-transferase C-terminal domain-containing protein [Cyanobium sp. FGCU-52]|nr:glutathione S-transferase C-terminal domain-containing protein [Cyanobium sp. FGCU52]
MLPPPVLVRTARGLWHWQWRRLMSGLGPADPSGRYRRPEAAFAALPELPANADQPGAHVLIVGRSCPWAHRAWLVWSLRRLAGSIDLLVVEPDPAAGRWRFREPFEGCATLADLYRRSDAPAGTRASVPVLVSCGTGRILANESARLIELLNQWPAPAGSPDLDPPERAEGCAAWRRRLQGAVNDGVYRCGFARSQAAYDEAEGELFAGLEAAEAELEQRERQGSGWLAGGEGPGLADVVLFTTLIRFELVYAPLFGCSRRPLWQLPALWRWRSRFFALEGVAATCDAGAWRRDYFGALFPLHPSGIVPAGPDLAAFVTSSPPR